MRHAPEYYEDYEVSLNRIKKGWIVAQYQGYCRLLFEPEDADLEEIYEIYGGEVQYYYAEKIPSTSLRVTDMSARRADDAKDPFGVEYRPVYMYYSIAEEKDEYYSSKYGALCYLAVDLVVVALVVGVNLLINRKTK